MEKEKIIILHNIRSAYNVGSVFRTADVAGVSRIYLTGYTPTPVDKFGRERNDIAKVSLGAEKTLPWQFIESIVAVTNELKKEGVEIVAVEQDKNSIDYKNYTPKEKTAFIFGNEVDGIEKRVLDLSEKIIEIPMHEKKESLNVSVAVGVVLFNTK